MRIVLSIKLIGLICLTLAGAALFAQDPPPAPDLPEKLPAPLRAVLLRFIQSERDLTMIGTRTTFVAPDSTVEETVKRLKFLTRIEYNSPDSYKGQLLLDHAKRAWHYQPQEDTWLAIRSPRMRQMFMLIQGLKNKTLTAKLDGKGKILDRNADIVEFSAKGKRIEKLWIDDPTGLVLRRERYDADNSMVGWFEYRTLNFNPDNLNRELFAAPPRDKVVYQELDDLKQTAPFKLFLPADNALPNGLTYSGGRIRNLRNKTLVAIHYKGNDKNLTLLQAVGVDGPLAPRTPRTQGGVNTYFWKVGDRALGLIGNFTVDELKNIAGTIVER